MLLLAVGLSRSRSSAPIMFRSSATSRSSSLIMAECGGKQPDTRDLETQR